MKNTLPGTESPASVPVVTSSSIWEKGNGSQLPYKIDTIWALLIRNQFSPSPYLQLLGG